MPPEFFSTWPNRTKAMTMVVATLTGRPGKLFFSSYAV